EMIRKVQNQALRHITAAFRTTPIRALELEACIPPIEKTLDRIQEGYATQLHSLGHRNPVIHVYVHKAEHLAMYSDGSLLENKRSGARSVGYSVVGYHGGRERVSRLGPMGSKSEVYDAEMAGLAWAAHDALQYAEAHPEVKHFHFFADNTAALKAIFDPKP
ncbi:hypothetical protein K438DRAFT_1503005, partial [Mycena galopus ATCC 62051]